MRIVMSMMVVSMAFAGPVSTADDPSSVPPLYRLPAATFEVKQTLKYTLHQSRVKVYDISFPSAVVSQHLENNTVVGEYFEPMNPAGKTPAVLVLDIMQGNQMVSRGQAVWLASRGIAAVTIHMPYYGPRRPANSRLKMITVDVQQSVANVQQAVLDGRRAVAWLANLPNVDRDRLGVVGTSLGSFIAGLVAASEPLANRACLLLSGGALVDSFYDHPKAEFLRTISAYIPGTKDGLKRLIAPVDPITYADALKAKKLLLIGASRDDIVPPVALEKLWQACGKPRIVWYDGTHVGGALYAMYAMDEVIRHLKQ
jgi:dienelactone hydrolase